MGNLDSVGPDDTRALYRNADSIVQGYFVEPASPSQFPRTLVSLMRSRATILSS